MPRIVMDVMTSRALAQTDQPQAVGVLMGIFLSSAKVGKIVESNLREASKVVWCNALK
jgi:hypothetical protein